MIRRVVLAAVAAFLADTAAAPPLCASTGDDAFASGLRLFNNKNYREAAAFFDKAVKARGAGSSAYYYDALVHHYLGDLRVATTLYREILSLFPGTEAASLAARALSGLSAAGGATVYDGAKIATGGDGTLSATAGNTALSSTAGSGERSDIVSGANAASGGALPDEARVYFRQAGGAFAVQGQIDGQGLPMIFDTGAEMTVVGKNLLRQMGLSLPGGGATGYAAGVGSGQAVPTWTMAGMLQVGDIVRREFPIVVMDSLDMALLGENFFKEYEYTIDVGSHSILFKRKGAAGSPPSNDGSVAFTRQGNEMIVGGFVNGSPCRMIFDTGAADTVVFTPELLGQVGLTVPADAAVGVGVGVGGATTTRLFNVDRIEVGPVERFNLRVSVVEAGLLDHPLVGQAFFYGWQYTIDNAGRVIRFLRR